MIWCGFSLILKFEIMGSVDEKKLVFEYFEVSWKLLIYKIRNNNVYLFYY